MRSLAVLVALLATTPFATTPLLAADAPPPDAIARVDAVFAKYAKADSPGCAVGIARGGKTILERGYGMANLEYDIPIAASTIFEAGSVSKQFTAAAVLLLAADGKLSLDEPVRKYIPELPDAAAAVTIRQILSHTSGLRDWGTVSGIAGWRRGTRAITHADVLDIIRRQRALNFAPGTRWSYSNSGYNLAAILVERVSGRSFPEFTRDRLFRPLGMTHSSWRDDYTRVVKGRATAYDPAGSGTYMSDMDVENIYGNCCLLTTVGDLLRWNENFRTPSAAVGAAITTPMQTPATLATGTRLDYGFGLFLREEAGQREIYHTGATAGYRALLTRRLDDDLSVALLCNRGDAPLGTMIESIAAAFVTPATDAASATHVEQPAQWAGIYRDPKTDAILCFLPKDDTLRLGCRDFGAALTPRGDQRFGLGRGTEIHFAEDGVHLTNLHHPETVYVRVAAATPSAAQLAAYSGEYTSDEAMATYTVRIEHEQLVMSVRPSRTIALSPLDADGFLSDRGDAVRFTRNGAGTVDGFDIKSDFSMVEGLARVERLHFIRK
jgi:CubicO group peptidase (beta-lactamase class C family)